MTIDCEYLKKLKPYYIKRVSFVDCDRFCGQFFKLSVLWTIFQISVRIDKSLHQNETQCRTLFVLYVSKMSFCYSGIKHWLRTGFTVQ